MVLALLAVLVGLVLTAGGAPLLLLLFWLWPAVLVDFDGAFGEVFMLREGCEGAAAAVPVSIVLFREEDCVLYVE